jgi:hypothetical protein
MNNRKIGSMDNKGYAFTPLAFLLFIPVIILAVSFSGIVNEVNALSSIAIGGDVTATVASNLVESIKGDTQDAGRNAAFNATRTVIDDYSGDNNPFFGGPVVPTDSRTYVMNSTLNLINLNITNTCRVLENQTGRNITINGQVIRPNDTNQVNIFNASNMGIVQSDPFGFNITLTSVPVIINQSSKTNTQSMTFNTPPINVYISIERLEDPYIWVNSKGRNSSVIFKYPYSTSSLSILNGTNNDLHFADSKSAGKLDFLWEELVGSNQSTFGFLPYYFPDNYGLSFFDRLENKTNTTSTSAPNTRMSTFVIWNPIQEDVGTQSSMIDHEYFIGVPGHSITSLGTIVTTPLGSTLYISNNTAYNTYLGLQYTY